MTSDTCKYCLEASRAFWCATACIMPSPYSAHSLCRCLHEIQAVASLPAHPNVIGQVSHLHM